MPSMPRRISQTWTSQKTANAIQTPAPNAGPAGPRAPASSVSSASPPIQVWMPNQPHATSARRIAGTLAPLHAEAGAAQHRERDAVFRAGVGVEDHRHQHDDVAEQDGQHRLPPGHALLHQPGGERVGGDDHAHADPERGDVIGGPGAARERRRREVGIPERAVRDVLGQLDDGHAGRISPSGRCARPRVAFGVVAAVVGLASGRRIFECDDDAVAPEAAEVLERRPAVALHASRPCPASSVLMTFGSDRVIEHRRRAHLHRAAAEQEVVERVRELGDAADARERLVGKRLRQLRHLGQRQRQDRRAAEAAARDVAVDVHLELERLRIDERQRRERVGRGDGVGAAEERAARFDDDVGRRRRELGPDRHRAPLPSRPA